MIQVNYPLFIDKNDRLRAWRIEFVFTDANPICITDDNGFHLTISDEQAKDLVAKILTVLGAKNDSNNQV